MDKEIKLILDVTHDAMIAVDTQGRITLFNQAAEKLTKQKAEVVLGKPIEQVIPSTRLPAVLETGQAELNLPGY